LLQTVSLYSSSVVSLTSTFRTLLNSFERRALSYE